MPRAAAPPGAAAAAARPHAHRARRQHLFRHARLPRSQRADVALRVRRDRPALGADGQGTAAGRTRAPACTRAPSTNGRCAGPRVDLARLAATPWKKLIAKAREARRTRPVLHHRIRAADDPARVSRTARPRELCVDLGEIRATRDGRARRAPIAEIEIELEQRRRAPTCFGLALALAADLPLAVMTDTKAERGYALRARVAARRAPRRCARRRRARRRRDDRRRAARRSRASACTRSPRTRRDSSPTTIPNGFTRCASARGDCARASRSSRRSRPPTLLDPVVAEVKWLAGVLGTARDWDVFVTRDAAAARRVVRARSRARRRASGGCARARRARRRGRARRCARGGRLAALSAPVAGRRGSLCATPRFGAPLAAPGTPARRRRARRTRRDVRGATSSRAAIASSLRVAADAGARVERGAARGADRRQAAALRRRVLRAALSGQAHPSLPRDARRRAGRARPAQRRRDRRRRSPASSPGPADDAAAGAVRGWVAAQAAALEPHARQGLAAVRRGAGRSGHAQAIDARGSAW